MTARLDDFSDMLLLELMQEAPDVAANLGLSSVSDIELDPAGMPDFSPDGYARRHQLLPSWRKRFLLDDIQPDRERNELSRAVLEHVLEEGVYSVFPGNSSSDVAVEPYPVTHISGVHTVLTALLVRDHPIATADELEAFTQRLSKAGRVVDGAVETLRLRRSEGNMAPRMCLELALEAIEKFLSPPTQQNLWLLALSSKAQRSAVDPAVVNRALATARRLHMKEIVPSYSRLVSELRAQLGDATEEAGAWRLSDGDAWYASRLRSCTTLKCQADAVHELGLREVDSVHQRMLDAARASGIQHKALGDVFGWLDGREQRARTNPPDDDLLPRIRHIIAVAEDRLRSLFGVWPDTEVRVEAIPESLQSMYTHYVPGSARGAGRSRDALLCVNTEQLRQLGEDALPMMVYHEVFPGHHLQLSAAAQAEHLSAFRRAMLFSGFLEGWAKYAERLGAEVVQLPDGGFATLAQLRLELYSTANMVLDTGLHFQRWSAQKCIDYFVTQTGASPALARIMVARSAAMPGQLTAYKMGMISIDAAMNRMKRHWGPRFQRRKFHDRVLSFGAVPLSVLDKAVDSAGLENTDG